MVLLAHVLAMVVPVTTGLPAGSVYVPDPFLDMIYFPFFNSSAILLGE
jgi:hypothetical protein